MKRLYIFKNLVCNAVILAVVLSIFALAQSGNMFVSSKPRAINSGLSDKNVSIMINVYWGSEYIRPILDILDHYEVKTTFFVGGTWAAQNESTLKEIFNAGHEIGNNGYYHKEHDKLNEQRSREEISITHKLIKSILDVEMTLFSPPLGKYNENTLISASSLGYSTIVCTVNSNDKYENDKNIVFNNALKNLKAGNIILMHPTQVCVDALPSIIEKIFEMGLNVDTITNTL